MSGPPTYLLSDIQFRTVKRSWWRESRRPQSTSQEPHTNSLSKSSPCQQCEVRSEAVDGPWRQNNKSNFNTRKFPEPVADGAGMPELNIGDNASKSKTQWRQVEGQAAVTVTFFRFARSLSNKTTIRTTLVETLDWPGSVSHTSPRANCPSLEWLPTRPWTHHHQPAIQLMPKLGAISS